MSYKISIIGSTGVLGTKLLSYLKKNNMNVNLLTCFSNHKKLLRQKKTMRTKTAIVLNPEINPSYNDLKYGDDFLLKHINKEVINIFYVLNIGYDSLKYIDCVIKSQKNCTIAIANKELLIAGGKLLIDKILISGNNFLPLDSEHFSLIELLPKRKLINNYISKIYLTASGGPFYFNDNFNINSITLKKASEHPIWKMGLKNSIDSSNLVNKILESFELSSLYNFPLSKIDIIISPKAFAHSVVFYNDRRIAINCFLNDMMIPLISPFYDMNSHSKTDTDIDIISNNDLKFIKFNNKKFQILKYYKKTMKFNHVQQINFMVLNAEAVNRFIQDEIEYKDIIPFIFSNIVNLSKINKFKNLYEITKYTNMLSTKVKKL